MKKLILGLVLVALMAGMFVAVSPQVADARIVVTADVQFVTDSSCESGYGVITRIYVNGLLFGYSYGCLFV